MKQNAIVVLLLKGVTIKVAILLCILFSFLTKDKIASAFPFPDSYVGNLSHKSPYAGRGHMQISKRKFLTVSSLSSSSKSGPKSFDSTNEAKKLRKKSKPTSSKNPEEAEVVVSNARDRRDALIARTAKLRQTIVKQQAELVELENQIACCTTTIDNNASTLDSFNNVLNKTLTTFIASTDVLKRKLERVHQKVGPNNKKWNSVSEYVIHELASGVRIVSGIVQKPNQIKQLIDPSAPTLVPHVPAILSRLDKLEDHVGPILERVLNNRQHLYSVEPYLDEILDRFDDIEPHLAWILDNIDALAPNTGLLLKHIDALLLFAESDEEFPDDAGDGDDNYSLANQLLPYLEYYVSKLDVIGPHLVYLRPHVPLLIRHNRIAKISPHIDKLFACGYKDLGASANIDILLFWFGWSLRVPGLPLLFFSLPFSPRLVTFLANRLPKKFARRGKSYCRGVTCTLESDYGETWNKLESRSS
mmetsp:Transcript_7431/g.8499  ORF Transcript_7431/g.8499 Transcript_7431/m.8499 type:complete len:474 (-) Transcript_7431:88-1509(-)